MKTDLVLNDEIFKLVVESSPNGILISDQQGKILLSNKHVEKLFGYKKTELTGEKIEKLVPNNNKKDHEKHRSNFLKNPRNRPMGTGRDLFALHKSGKEFPVEIGLSHINTSKGVLILATITDLSERVRAETALKESEYTLQAIINNSPDAILVYDDKKQVIKYNKEAKKLFDLNESKKININMLVPPEHELNFSKILNKVKEGNTFVDYEMEKIVHDGSRLGVSIGLVYVPGEKGMYIETIRDITERVKLRNKILEFEKAQIVSKMSEGIAHHMGTPLASMLLRTQMMRDDISAIDINQDLYESFREKLNSIEKQIYYGQKVMQRLLKFAAKPTNEKTVININSLIQEILEIIKPLSIKSAITVEIKSDYEANVLGDSDMLQLVFSDICMNAIDAMSAKGDLKIKISLDDSVENQVNILVSDTGTGIPKDVLPFVFEPFFSTKPAGKGTGLGLSVAKRIIQDHNGTISINSTEKKGTDVLVKLPEFIKEK